MATLKIVCISDTHEHFLRDMPEGDVLVHAGDFTYTGSIQKVREFNSWLGSIKHKYKYGIVVIAGNHDKSFHFRPDEVQGLLTNCIYLQDSGVNINGFNFWGSPWTPEFGRSWAFNANRADIFQHWDLIPEGTDVLITHGPPLNILDWIPQKRWDSNGNKAMEYLEHVGCYDLARYVKSLKPLLHVFGHIHEANGTEEHGGTWYVNASIMDEHYDPVNKPFVITITKEGTP